MTDKEVLEIIKRKTTIPEPGESFDYVSTAYDRAIQIIEAYMAEHRKTGAFLACEKDWPCPDYGSFLEAQARPSCPDPAQYLHGGCEVFAVALNNVFGYPIYYLTDATRFANVKQPLNSLAHAYCKSDGKYVDVRGITTDVHELVDEFEDFFSTPKHVPSSAHELRDKLFGGMDETEARQRIQAAADFIRSHEDWYRIDT